jgi:hypothetical protein
MAEFMYIEKVEIHYHNHIDTAEILSTLNIIKLQNTKIMADFAALKTEFDSLKAAIAEERAQATAKLTELQASIDNLTANIQQGGTAEERDQLLADITAQIAEVKAIIPDSAAPTE